MRTIISYNEHEVKTDGSLDDLGNGYNVWIDLIDPDHEELLGFGSKFNLDPEALETYFNKSKKPEIRVLDNHTFTVILDMKNKDPKTGKPLKNISNYGIGSKLFDLYFPADDVFNAPKNGTAKAAHFTYSFLFKPLSKGEHRLHINTASDLSYQSPFSWDVTYILKVQ